MRFPFYMFKCLNVPQSVDQNTAVEAFNTGEIRGDVGCHTRNISCENCILYWENARNILAFADMARFCGHKITRRCIAYNNETNTFEWVKNEKDA